MVTSGDECCKLIRPEDWDGQTVRWEDKLFVCGHVRSFFHIPLNYGQVVDDLKAKVEAAGADTGENLMLTDESSAWGSQVMVPVSRPVPGMPGICLTGTFMTKVFEGSFRGVHQWYLDMLGYVKDQGKEPGRVLFFYTVCPKCAKKYGKNYAVLFAEVH